MHWRILLWIIGCGLTLSWLIIAVAIARVVARDTQPKAATDWPHLPHD